MTEVSVTEPSEKFRSAINIVLAQSDPSKICVVCDRERGEADGQCVDSGSPRCFFECRRPLGELIKHLADEANGWHDVATRAVESITKTFAGVTRCGWCHAEVNATGAPEHGRTCSASPIAQRLTKLIEAAKAALEYGGAFAELEDAIQLASSPIKIGG